MTGKKTLALIIVNFAILYVGCSLKNISLCVLGAGVLTVMAIVSALFNR